LGLTKQAVRKVRIVPDRSAQSKQLIRMLCASHVAATPRNVIGSFKRAAIVVRWSAADDRLFAEIVLAAADRAQELFLHEGV
jgi:hypothetical protein